MDVQRLYPFRRTNFWLCCLRRGELGREVNERSIATRRGVLICSGVEGAVEKEAIVACAFRS